MKLILGLGNPGLAYYNTKHNVGFRFVDYIAQKNDVSWSSKKNLWASIAKVSKKNFLLCKPNLYMNLSGRSVFCVMNYYKISIENLFIIHDDIDLPFLHCRCKLGGSSGGHNGLKSVDGSLNSNLYFRLRIGVGRVDKNLSPDLSVAKYVLSDFTHQESEALSTRISLIYTKFDFFLEKKIESFKRELSKINSLDKVS